MIRRRSVIRTVVHTQASPSTAVSQDFEDAQEPDQGESALQEKESAQVIYEAPVMCGQSVRLIVTSECPLYSEEDSLLG